MKTKLLLQLTALLLLLAGYKASAQLEYEGSLPTNLTQCAKIQVDTGGVNYCVYDKCNGVLKISLNASNTNGLVDLNLAYIYVKLSGTWKNMLTLRKEGNLTVNATAGSSAGPDYGIVSSSASVGTNYFYLHGDNTKRKIGNIDNKDNGTAGASFSYSTYEDEGICKSYDANLNHINNTMSFANFEPPHYNATLTNAYGVTGGYKAIGYYRTTGGGYDEGINFAISNLPPEAIQGNSMAIRIYKHYRRHDKTDDTDCTQSQLEYLEYNVSVNAIDAPFALTATGNQCGKVTLNWQNPAQVWSSQYNCSDAQNYRNVIYREGVKIGIVDGDTSRFVDNSAALQPRVNYNYTVKTILWNNDLYNPSVGNTSGAFRSSAASNVAIGGLKQPPAQPSPFNATDDKCNTLIELDWSQPNGTAVAQYSYTKYNQSTFASNTSTIISSARLFSETAITRGINYTMKLVAKNDCGYPSDTAMAGGISIADPIKTNTISVATNSAIATATVTWVDASNNETKYQIERQDDLGNTVYFDVNADATSYIDNTVASCRQYKYYVKVFNSCVLSGIRSDSSVKVLLPPPSLNTTFTSTKKLLGSKGYFGNRVELSWSNNNGVNVDLFKIYRKDLSSSMDSIQIASLSGINAFFIDYTCDSRVFYRYTIVGIKNCLGSEILTNTSSDIGFRNPSGLVSGHIEYTGGVAVSGAKVLVQQSGALSGSSINFTGGSVSVADAIKLEPNNEMRLEFWFKPVAVSGTVVQKTNAFDFMNTGSNYQARIYTGGTPKTITVPTASFPNNQWNHISMVYNGSVFKLFANGILSATTSATGAIDDNANNLIIGNASASFLMDEFRLMGKASADSVIFVERNRILNGNETGFKCNLHFDEGVGRSAYDVSKVGNAFNENHGLLVGSVSASSDIPSNAQLGYFGVTDTLGNYIVTGIQYLGLGENFNIVPSFATHSFSPNSRSVYIGDASYVYNNQDFTDNSSFSFTGTLYYKGTSCPVPGAGLKIDGLPVIAYGTQAVTDAAGSFSISVPIGNHFVTIEKFGHGMNYGRYPIIGTHNFQAPLPPVPFEDSTLLKVIGRVVGGTVEAGKVPGLGRSINNIGSAVITLATPIAGVACFTTSTITNSLTGEYEFNIPPLGYKIVDAYVMTNSVTISKPQLSNTNQVLDITNALYKTLVVDTLFDNLHGIVSIDSVRFNRRLDMIYRSSPEINVSMLDGSKLIGDDTLKVGVTKLPIKPILGNMGTYGWGPFNWPVFTQHKTYKAKITANEVYTNFDNATPVTDTVLLNANAFVTNDLVDGIDPNSAFSFANGVGTYSFVCGSPNIADNTITPSLGYTKDIQVVVVPDGASSVPWQPNATITPSNGNFHAIVVGKRITGTGISTQGPEQLDFILRDPPGSGSSSKWTSGSTVTKTSSFSNAKETDAGISTDILLGAKNAVGIGFIVETSLENSVTLGLSIGYNKSSDSTMTEEITSSNSVGTRDDADYVGAPADIFIGRSRNWLVGPTANIELIDAATCSGNCFGTPFGGKSLALKIGYAVAPDNVRTRFSYTQEEIENTVIPQLEAIRNTILLNSPAKYSTSLLPSNPKFGSNNDDPIWGALATSTTPTVYDPVDSLGQSYTFRGYAKIINQDTVRILNTQIALWKQALAQNEREKLACKNNTGGVLIDNFTLGSAIVNNVYQVDNTKSITRDWELALSNSISGQLGFSVGGFGVLVKPSLALKQVSAGSSNTVTTITNTFDYTLTDGDQGDIMSIDVYKSPEGTGNIFITRGGQTMCPYEDAVVCHYFNPSGPNDYIGSHTYNATGFATIANATVQREMPNIAITPANQLNIPSNQAAVYQIILTNQSPLTINNDIDMQVRIASASNPYGAVLKIDGQNANSLFNIPSGGSVIKTLTIERGPIEINYDSLMVIFSSACSEDIADTSYVSVHFIPTCTDLAITVPTDNFIVNNSNNNLENITISDYNYNYGVAANTSTLTSALHPNFGFEKIGYEIKPGNSSTWLEIKDFYKVPNPTQSAIPNNQIYTQYQWTVTPQIYPDGNYEIRAVSYCYNKDGSYATVISPVLGGVMDRVNPSPFGTPTPGDGILDPNDDISIQFNEPIDLSSLSTLNFDIRGVLNGTNIRHSESLNFDGTADYAEVSGGASLQKRSFTIEFWAKLNTTGINQVAISQGSDPVQRMEIGFDNSNNLKFMLGSQTVTSLLPVSIPTDWHHYAVVYDYAGTDALLFVDGSLAGTNNNFIVDYIGAGKLVFGKAIPSNSNFLSGNLQEVRLWNDVRTISEITVTMNQVLNRNQSGLMYNWKIDEAEGSLLKDDIRSRNADIYGATWEINPNGYAAQFDGVDDNIQVSSGNIAINKEMDFTLEFWFNSTQSNVASLFSNGKGDGVGADSLDAWNIQKDAAGAIHVFHKGYDFVATTNNFFDGTWHHFALVMNRNGNLSSYIDGNLENSVQALSFNNLSSSYLYLGARGYQTGTITNYDNHFNGKMDEFRLWNTARKTEQIKRDKQNRMIGNEYGLQSFMPFEHYATVLGTPSLTATFIDQSVNTLTVNAQNGVLSINQTPTIKLPRPVQTVNYSWSLNNDKIILTPTTAPELIENVTLDITVKNAYDMHGNIMQSPKTWIAYINKNQVKWQDDQFNFVKTIDSVITFTAPIVNSGGALKAFTIDGLPSWITASTTSGVISPNSVQNVVFTIPAGGSIGDFSADISVMTDFNYAEILQVNLKVTGTVPTWSVNPSDFQYSMNIFGQMKIDGVMATNPENKIAAFNNGVICGVADLQYVPAYDRYEVFLNVYSNTITGDSIRFNIYDASSGLTFVNVTPSLMFVENDVIGTVTNPVTFIANTEIALDIPLNGGWTWISLPLKSAKLANSNLLMSSISPSTGDVVLSTSNYDQYDSGLGWLGNISQGSGFFNNQSYKVKTATMDTLVHIGERINPDSTIATINVVPGWNWIGYVSTKNVGIAEALGNYNAVTGDLIKSQYEFAYYDNATGWTGSLTNMKPTMGYMLKSTGTSTFHYPLSTYIGKMANTATNPGQSLFPFTPEMYANTMSAIITGNICNEALDQGNVAIGAFDATNTMRGYAFPIKNTTNNIYNFYLTLYSNTDGDALTLKYFNVTDGTVLPTGSALSFTTNALAGTPSVPVTSNVDASVSCNVVYVTTGVNELSAGGNVGVYPNPFSDNLTLNFASTVSAKIELIDLLGKVVYSSTVKNKKEHTVYLGGNSGIAAGMYYIRITGDVNEQIKVIKTK